DGYSARSCGILTSDRRRTWWSGRRAALRIPLETDRPTSGAATERDLACAPARDPCSDTSGFSPPRRNRFPAAHPSRWSDTTGDAHEIRCPDPAADSPPVAVTLFPKELLLVFRQSTRPHTRACPTPATSDIPLRQ